MRLFFKTFFSRCITGRAMRAILIAGVMLYVMVMTFCAPTLLAYAEAVQIKDENPIEIVGQNQNSISSDDEINIDDAILDDKVTEETAEATNISRLSSQREATVVSEDMDARTETSKRFLMSDGSYTIEQYSQPVHYLKNGKYEDIDNTLVRSDTDDKTIYTNSSNYYKSSFEEDKDGVKKTILQWNDYEINWIIENKEKNSNEQKISVKNGK